MSTGIAARSFPYRTTALSRSSCGQLTPPPQPWTRLQVRWKTPSCGGRKREPSEKKRTIKYLHGNEPKTRRHPLSNWKNFVLVDVTGGQANSNYVMTER